MLQCYIAKIKAEFKFKGLKPNVDETEGGNV